MPTVWVDGVAQRVEHKRKHSEEDDEGYDAGVEELLRGEDVGQLRQTPASAAGGQNKVLHGWATLYHVAPPLH